MVKKINILFVCKHNLFRSQVANAFFKKLNKNKKYQSYSAGIIKFNKKDLLGDDKGYEVEKKISEKYGIKLKKNSKGLSSSLLKKTNILIIVADDVPSLIFKKENSFNGKIFVWKVPDVKFEDIKKEKIAFNTIEYIKKKINKFINKLK